MSGAQNVSSVPRCTCRNFGPHEYREVDPKCPVHRPYSELVDAIEMGFNRLYPDDIFLPAARVALARLEEQLEATEGRLQGSRFCVEHLHEQLKAAEKALRWAGYGPMPGGGWAKVYREESSPASGSPQEADSGTGTSNQDKEQA